MALTWSSCQTLDWGGKFATGLSVSATTHSNGTSTVSVHVYERCCSGSTGSMQSPTPKIEVTGSSSWTANNVSHDSITPGTYKLLKSWTYSTSASTSVTFSARILERGSESGPDKWSAKVTQTITTPPTPVPPPGKPTNLTVTRVDDSQQKLTWTPGSNADGQWVRRSTGYGWQNIAQLSGSASTYTDNSTEANREYQYSIRAYNGGGSAYLDSPVKIDTTPAPPGAPTAQRQGDGSIIITRGSLPDHATHWEVWHAANGVWDSTRLALVSAASSTWTYSSPPPAASHTFRTTSVTDNPVLTSAPSATYSVSSEAAPAAPTNLTPNGVAVDRNLATKVFTWQHNPTDTTPQRKFKLRYRVDGGSWTDTGEVTSGTSSWSTTGLTSPGQVEWQVQTWGNHADPSPWSAVASFPLTTAPAATITAPTDSQVITTPQVTITWTYFQADSSSQESWEVRLVNDSSETTVASDSGTGTTSSWTSPAVLENLASYRAEVRVRSSVGVWSSWDNVLFSVGFTPPPPPGLIASWRDEGYVFLDITPGTGTPETVSLSVERSIDGGPYVLLAENLDPGSAYLDWTAPILGDVSYRVTSWSDPPGFSQTVENLVVDEDDECLLWLSGGPSYSLVARLELITKQELTTGRSRVLNEYAGRAAPVETSSPLVRSAWSITVIHIPTDDSCSGTEIQSTREELERLFALPGPHLLRGSGIYMYGTLSDLSQGHTYRGESSFTIERSDSGTLEQRKAIGTYTGQVLVEALPGEYLISGGSGFVTSAPGEYEWSS